MLAEKFENVLFFIDSLSEILLYKDEYIFHLKKSDNSVADNALIDLDIASIKDVQNSHFSASVRNPPLYL